MTQASSNSSSATGLLLLLMVAVALVFAFVFDVSVALPAAVSDASDSDRYSLEFFMQGPALGDGSDDEGQSSSKSDNSKGGHLLSPDEPGGARWFVPLADGAHPEELKKVRLLLAPAGMMLHG